MIEDDEDAAGPAPARAARMSGARKAVVNRLWRAARRQLDAHEARLDALPKGAAAAETDAKALATLARTVRELVALEATTTQGSKPADELSPTAALRHVAGLRQELARRLEGIAAGMAGAGAEGADGDGLA